jgi:hypothetical protein
MRQTIENQRQINIKDVAKYILLTTGKPLQSRDDGYYADYEYQYYERGSGDIAAVEVLVESITPNYGGYRYYLVCAYCHRSYTNLYPTDTSSPACRKCLELEYASRSFADYTLALDVYTLDKINALKNRRKTYASKNTRAGRRYFKYMNELWKRYPDLVPIF